MTTKPIWQSKIFWLNLIAIATAILAITDPGVIGIKPATLLWINGVLNILLRYLTTERISLTGNSGKQA